MPSQYISFCRSQSSTSGNLNAQIDIATAASTIIEIVRVRVCHSVPGSDCGRVVFCRKSAIGAGSIAGTIVKKDPLDAASTCTATKKNGANDYAVGTITDTLDEIQFNARGQMQWEPIDDDDKIRIESGGIFGINLASQTGDLEYVATIEWKEL